MTLKRRITVIFIAGLVIAAVVGVYYMPQSQQTPAAAIGPSTLRLRCRV